MSERPMRQDEVQPGTPGLAALEDPGAGLDALVACARPCLVGVRHHSAACAAAMPALLDAFRPGRILVELPTELQAWLPWLGHPELQPPVALAGARERGELVFYPFAEFSPELAAVRWAVAHDVPVEAFDLPVAAREAASHVPDRDPSLVGALLRHTGAADVESMWDRLVEARAPGATPEQVRRAALGVGLALRRSEALGGGVSTSDLQREAHMRARVEAATEERVVAIVGAFHAPALLPEPVDFAPVAPAPMSADPVVTSLIPYADELLDTRSGYPAGIRDPVWQRRAFEALSGQADSSDLVIEFAVGVCRALRAAGHVAGTPDAAETSRVARDLAGLRGLPAAGRRELLEGLETVLAQGELLGRGRAVARAAESVLVGRRRGRLAPGTPRSGLAPHVEGLLAELGLPGPDSLAPVRMRLDPLRSDLDRRRHTVLVRLTACGVPYGRCEDRVDAGDLETLTEVWSIAWQPATAALLELGGTRGVTLAQAAVGALQAQRARLLEHDELGAAARLRLAMGAAECGLSDLLVEALAELMGPFLDEATLQDLLGAFELVERLRRRHVPALPDDFELPPDVRTAELLAAGVRALDGLGGSDAVDDARAMLALVRLFERDEAPGTARLEQTLDALARDGSPVISGASEVLRAQVGREAAETVGERIGSWVDAAANAEGRAALAGRLRGALCVAAPLFEASPAFATPLLDRVEAQSDDAFLERLPALREGFEVLSPAARGRLLEVLTARLGGEAPEVDDVEDPERLALYAAADRAGRAGWGTETGPWALAAEFQTSPGQAAVPRPPTAHGLSARDRWRLILGRESQSLCGLAGRAAGALDELYGAGQGEGSRELGAGRGPAFPTVREWSEALSDVFGEGVRDEVLGVAAAGGNAAAALEVEVEKVTPSVELLEQLLALRGAMPQGHMDLLRRRVAHVVDALVAALATRIRPALTGLASPRPTSRRGGPLDLGRTLRVNLKHLRAADDGSPAVVCERLIFRTRARRSLDWRIVLVVDVSGSMEASVIYSAMMAAILSGLPAVSVHFLAFSTQVVDLTDRVDDPLALLLEVKVGGGTHIAKALRHARSLVTVPARTLVLCLSDFEEGGSVGALLAEVRALVESGVRALGLAALDDHGKPRYARAVAEQVAGAGMPVAALTPSELARWIAEQVR
ncbi:MAG: DUF5682 family protein [Bradymonadia bacterium]